VLAIACVLVFWPALRALKALYPLAATSRAIGSLMLAYSTLFLVLLPRADYLWISKEIALTLRERDPDRTLPLADAGFYEDSLLFITRGRVQRITDHDSLAEFVRTHPRSLIISGDLDMLQAVLTTMREFEGLDVTHAFVTSVSGYNYSRGEFESPHIREILHE
jgi:hypothetical protein